MAQSLPGAHIPHTRHGHTAAPSPSPLISGMGRENGVKPVLPPCRLAPPVGSPYRYPSSRADLCWLRQLNGTIEFSQMNPNVVREQFALQMQIYALNNDGMVSDSSLSPSSTPFPGPQCNLWALLLQTSNVFGGRRGGIPDSTASMRLSLSRQPASLPPLVVFVQVVDYATVSVHGTCAAEQRFVHPRVLSTQPRYTSPEAPSGEKINHQRIKRRRASTRTRC